MTNQPATGVSSPMMRLIAPALVVMVLGLMAPTVAHAQSAATTAQREVDRVSAMTKSAWRQVQDETRERWSKLTDDDMLELDGRREVLIAKLRIRYSLSHEDAERQVGDFEARRP